MSRKPFSKAILHAAAGDGFGGAAELVDDVAVVVLQQVDEGVPAGKEHVDVGADPVLSAGCEDRAAPRCGECSGRTSRGVSRERCCASRPTGRLRVREASGSPSVLRARRRRREGVDQAIRCGGTAPWRWAARASCRQVNAPSVWALTRSSKEASLMSTVAMDRWRLVGLSARRRRRARRWSGGRASRRRRSVSALLHAQVAGAAVFSARCSRLPLGVSSTGWAGGLKEPPARGGGAGPRTVDWRCRWPSGRSSDRTRSLGKPARPLPRSAAFPVVSWSTPAISETPPGNCRVLVERTQQFRRGSDRFGFGRARAAATPSG